MVRFGILLPRAELVEPAGRIASELGMNIVLNRWVKTDEIISAATAGVYFEGSHLNPCCRNSTDRARTGATFETGSHVGT